MSTPASTIRLVVASALFVAAALAAPEAGARSSMGVVGDVLLADLPVEAREVNALIRQGGPFHYDRDGVVFGNREKYLPAEPRGYYHEYTVPTPGASSRGARRIICGGPATQPHDCWYTSDHYRSFRRIRE